MKIAHPALVFLCAAILVLTGPTAPAAEKEKSKKAEKVTLEDVIFDVNYLKNLLGPKTLVTAVVESSRGRKKSDTDLADGIAAVKDARLDEHSQIFALPDDATQPELKSSVPHNYPPGLKIPREGRNAKFLVLIAADGAVKCLYCYSQDDRLFALAAAQAVVKWHFQPAKIQGVAVPVVARLAMSINADEARMTDPSRRKLEAPLPISPYMRPAAPATPPPN